MSQLGTGSLEDVAFVVCTAMDNANVLAILSGGGAAAFYAPKAYETRDLDFVLHLSFVAPSADPILNLGFQPSVNRGVYEHAETPFTLEFLDGPLGIGEEVLSKWETIHREGQVLHVISPTDSVRDRLSAGIAWGDPNAAIQAAEIAKLHPIDLDLVRDWCAREGGESTFRMFLALLGRPSL